MTSSVWFPRPRTLDDLRLVGHAGQLRLGDAFALLERGGDEWHEKVGVAGPVDGSAKATTRLLHHDGWVFKTNMTWAMSHVDDACARARHASERESELGLWHASKQWMVLASRRGWLPLSACRKLRIVRSLATEPEKFDAWTDLLATSLTAAREQGVGLDMNPANFAYDGDGGRLYYVDDETYGPVGLAEVASFLVARIPEEPSLAVACWHAWGVRLQTTLTTLCATPAEWLGLTQALSDYPLHERFHAQRSALREGLMHQNARARRACSTRMPCSVTCVIADVHANEPALEAVLRAAAEDGADSYLFLGDAVGYGPHPGRCVRRLAELKSAVHVRGNHDNAVGFGRWQAGANHLARDCGEWTRSVLSEDELTWLRSLPTDHQEDDWIAVHGAPKDPHRFLAYVYELTYEENMDVVRRAGLSLCFYGHTHVQFVHRCLMGHTEKLGAVEAVSVEPRHPLLINPGSVGQPRDGQRTAAYALWNRSTSQVALRRVPYDLERTLADLRKAGLASALADRLESGR